MKRLTDVQVSMILSDAAEELPVWECRDMGISGLTLDGDWLNDAAIALVERDGIDWHDAVLRVLEEEGLA